MPDLTPEMLAEVRAAADKTAGRKHYINRDGDVIVMKSNKSDAERAQLAQEAKRQRIKARKARRGHRQKILSPKKTTIAELNSLMPRTVGSSTTPRILKDAAPEAERKDALDTDR